MALALAASALVLFLWLTSRHVDERLPPSNAPTPTVTQTTIMVSPGPTVTRTLPGRETIRETTREHTTTIVSPTPYPSPYASPSPCYPLPVVPGRCGP